ncbi:MAG TPA: hypothetical protein VF861_01270 [Telluria sp.]
MQKLVSELIRLYVPAGAISPEDLAQHIAGQATHAVKLNTAEGLTRSMVIPFQKLANDREEAQHWTRLCAVANALQSELGFPPPAVSISGSNGYGLWLSLETGVPSAQAQRFLQLLRQAYFPDMELAPDAINAQVELPPCLNQASGKWAAFIHPGMGASFAEESGLEMAPPLAGQAAFLEGLQSISEAQFRHALDVLQPPGDAEPAREILAQERALPPQGLLLRDATLEDIVAFLHAKNIEPTFRHLIPNK